MISRGSPETNQAKVAEHGITFPVALQKSWEISREYGMFATPIAYLVDEQGVIAGGVAVGGNAILSLAAGKDRIVRDQLELRLEALKRELEAGQVELEKVEKQRTYLRETMLRISGAVQVLQELLTDGQAAGHDGSRNGVSREAAAVHERPSGSQVPA
jgi:hypothetical protein